MLHQITWLDELLYKSQLKKDRTPKKKMSKKKKLYDALREASHIGYNSEINVAEFFICTPFHTLVLALNFNSSCGHRTNIGLSQTRILIVISIDIGRLFKVWTFKNNTTPVVISLWLIPFYTNIDFTFKPSKNKKKMFWKLLSTWSFFFY